MDYNRNEDPIYLKNQEIDRLESIAAKLNGIEESEEFKKDSLQSIERKLGAINTNIAFSAFIYSS